MYKKLLLATLAAIFAGSASAWAVTPAAFGPRSFNGNYTFHASGLMHDDGGDPNGWINITGLITPNGAGAINTAVDIQVSGGDDLPSQFDCAAITSIKSGSYAVNSDGTATFTLNFNSGDACLPNASISFTTVLTRSTAGLSPLSSTDFSITPGQAASSCVDSTYVQQIFLAEESQCATDLVLDGDLAHQ